jgi:hypothetical protein
MQKKSRRSLYWLLALVFLVILAVVLALARLPNVKTQLAAKSPDIAITIVKPGDGTQWYLNSSIKIFANAFSAKPVQSLELWVDGSLVPSARPEKGNYGQWVWVVKSPGAHTLLVRAKDSSGAIGNSNVVRVIGLASSLPGMQLVYLSQNGDTAQSIAQKYGLAPDDLKKANPKMNPDGTFPPGTPVKIPIVFAQVTPAPENSPTQAPPAPAQSAPTLQASKLKVWVSQYLDQTPPQAPGLTVSVNACAASLSITNSDASTLGFIVYRLDPNAQSFQKIASLGPGNGSTPIPYNDPNLYGKFSYYVSAFNGQGESPSNIAATEVSAADCLTPYWSGTEPDVPLPTGPIPPLPKPAKYDKAYYYLSINGSVKQRVPAAPNQFLDLPNGIFNVNDQFTAIAASQPQGQLAVEMDAWGWNGGALIHIGDFKRAVTGQQTTPSLDTTGLLQICSLGICDTSGLGGSFGDQVVAYGYANWPFLWAPNSTQVTTGLVQVSVSPFDATCNANPDGLVYSNTITAPGTGSTSFLVNFGPLQNATVFVNGSYVTNATQFYIRVLPQVNGQTACPPTNSVIWSYQQYVPGPTMTAAPKAPVPPNPYQISIVDFQPIHYPDAQWAHCVVVNQNPYYGIDPAQLTLLGYDQIWTQVPVGGWVCPAPHSGGYTPPDPSFVDQLSSWVGQGLDFVANAYNSLKGYIVQLADTLNPLCLQAKVGSAAIGQGQTTVDDVCHAVAEATVDAGLAFVGLPPSLPNYSDVVNASKGYLVEAAAQEFEAQTGLPCDDACKQVISSGLDATVAKIAQSQNDSACTDVVTAEDDGYEPLCNPPGVQTVPDSRGQLSPAFATLQITRDPSVPDSAFPDPNQFNTSCSWQFSVAGKNDAWIGQQFPFGNDPTVPGNPMIWWQGTELDGGLFLPFHQSIPALAPGESITIPLTLQPKTADYPSEAGFWILQHKITISDYNSIFQIPEAGPDDWTMLYNGALATANASTTCDTSAKGAIPSKSPLNSDSLQYQIPFGK